MFRGSPALDHVPHRPLGGEDHDYAFRRESRRIVQKLVGATDGVLGEKWDNEPWTSEVEHLPTWKVDEFYEAADPAQ